MDTAEEERSALLAHLAAVAVPFAQQRKPPRFKQAQVLGCAVEAFAAFSPCSTLQMVLFMREEAEWELGATHPDLFFEGTVAVDPIELRCPADLLPIALWESNVYDSSDGGQLAFQDGWLWVQGTFRAAEWRDLHLQLRPVYAANRRLPALPAPAEGLAVISTEAVRHARTDLMERDRSLAAAEEAFVRRLASIFAGIDSGQPLICDAQPRDDQALSWTWATHRLPLHRSRGGLLLMSS